jgi:hypothetical protein
MAKPKHKRCGICNCVTSRYSHTQDAGAFVVKIWVRDPKNGEATRENGNVIRCAEHVLD